MPNQPPPSAPAEVVVLDNSPPRRQASSPSASNEVIVLDQSPRSNNQAHPTTHSEPIVVEENPPKRRRRDHPASLPLHPRATSPSQNAPPVIVVEDDDDSSDPESPPASNNSAPFTSVGQVASGTPHVRLPRINTPRNVPVQDDIIEMSARGPNVNRDTATVPAPLVPPICPPPTPPTRTRHTSMPPLFSFTQRSMLGPEVTAPPPPNASRSIPRPILRQLPRFNAAHHSNTNANANVSRQIVFPHPLPEQALPSTGRRSVRGSRHVSFSDSIPEGALGPGATATLSVLRGREDHGIQGTAPTTALPRHSGEPFIQVVNGPSVYLDTPQNSVQNAVPQSINNSHVRRNTDSQRQSSFAYSSLSLRRRQGARRAPAYNAANPAHQHTTGTGVHRNARIGAQGLSRAHIQQLNAMHAASHGMPLQDDGLSFLPQNSVDPSHSSVAPSHQMTVTANLRNASSAPRVVASAVDAAATAVARLPSAGLTLSTSQIPLSYGQGNTFAMSSSGNTTSGRHRNHNRHATAQRHAHRIRGFQRLVHFAGSTVTASIEIQYLHGLHGDRALDYEQLIRLDEQLIRERNRADKSQIDALPMRTATSEDKEIRCCVCMCDVETGEELRILPCSHKYHKKCIDEWLTYNGCCPVDKKRIAPRTSRTPYTTG